MDITLVILRLVHLFGAVLWAGTTFAMVLFISPTAQAVGAEAGKFMTHLNKNAGISRWMASASGLTVLSGLWMYYILFDGMAPMNVGNGLALNIGVLAGLAAFGMGMRVGKVSKAMGGLGEAMGTGGQPQPEQVNRMGELQEKMARHAAVSAILMMIALAGMTLSEYFTITF